MDTDEYLHSDIVGKHPGSCSIDDPVHTCGHRETGSSTTADCSQHDTSSVGARCNWVARKIIEVCEVRGILFTVI
jgi:hypothetical protein